MAYKVLHTDMQNVKNFAQIGFLTAKFCGKPPVNCDKKYVVSPLFFQAKKNVTHLTPAQGFSSGQKTSLSLIFSKNSQGKNLNLPIQISISLITSIKN